MAICPLCGKIVKPTQKNATIIDGVICHKKCPEARKKPVDPNKKLLIDEIYHQFETNAKGYILNTGFNHYKLLNQIKVLCERGYSYQDQLYALKKVVESQDGFYGYTSVVNQISRIIVQKRKRDELLSNIQKTKQEKVVFDANKFMEGDDNEW